MRSLHCLFPNFDDCVTVCSNTIELEKLIWGRSLTFRDNSEVTDPDYVSKVHLCRAKIRAEQWLNPTQLSSLLTLEGNPGTVHGKLGADCICERHKSSPGLTCAVRKRSPRLTCEVRKPMLAQFTSKSRTYIRSSPMRSWPLIGPCKSGTVFANFAFKSQIP